MNRELVQSATLSGDPKASQAKRRLLVLGELREDDDKMKRTQ
jgi:hypothetical protein